MNLLDLFRENKLFGTVHTCVGQEFCATALYSHVDREWDAAFSNHRCHGHFIAYGGPIDGLLAELMGRAGGVCSGRGGSQHLYFRKFFSNGVQGGTTPVAVGYAWANLLRRQNGIVVAHIGDGTLGEGVVYEAFAFAALLKAPVLFLLEHNGYAQSTDTRGTTPGDILKRAEGFGLEADLVEDGDPEKLWERLRDAVAHVRQGNPLLQVIKTRRLCAHSKGDDSRPRALVEELWRYDPFEIALRDSAQVRLWYEEAKEEIRQVTADVSRRERQPFQPFDPMAAGNGLPRNSSRFRTEATGIGPRVVEALNGALTEMMEERSDVIMVGEDLQDPYGGAFKVTRGLSTRFPSRVFSTPISEAAIVGVSNGLGLAGMRPVAEIMFADFATLATDQIVNQAAKYFSMYAGQVTCPVKIRLVSGGYRGYGPTHSQSLEALYCGIPGLRVVALSERHDAGRLMTSIVLDDENPVIFVENKALYAKSPVIEDPPGMSFRKLTGSYGNYPPLHYVPEQQVAASVTVVTYGGTVPLVEEAITQCTFEQEMCCEYFILTQLWPLEVEDIVRSVERTRRLVIVEEGTPEFGVGAAVVAQVARQLGGRVPFACECVGARAESIPSAKHLEEEVLPSKQRIVEALDLVHGRTWRFS